MTERRADKILARAARAAHRRRRSGATCGATCRVTQAYLVLSEVLGHLDLLEARGAVPAAHDGVVVYARA